MFGGDWPVSTLATDYPRWVETVLWATESCSETERRRLFRETAAGFYRLS
jgi:L-fuconolactonase